MLWVWTTQVSRLIWATQKCSCVQPLCTFSLNPLSRWLAEGLQILEVCRPYHNEIWQVQQMRTNIVWRLGSWWQVHSRSIHWAATAQLLRTNSQVESKTPVLRLNLREKVIQYLPGVIIHSRARAAFVFSWMKSQRSHGWDFKMSLLLTDVLYL